MANERQIAIVNKLIEDIDKEIEITKKEAEAKLLHIEKLEQDKLEKLATIQGLEKEDNDRVKALEEKRRLYAEMNKITIAPPQEEKAI